MGSTEINQPSPPPQPSTAEAIQAWADVMPQIMETQMEYAPLQAQQQVELAQQYAAPLGQAYQQAQAEMYPETQALQEDLATQASEGMDEGLTPDEMQMYRDIYAANLGTSAGAPIGADYMGRNLMQQDIARKDYYRNLGLSVAGRQPLANPQTPATGQYSQGFSPQGVMNYKASTYGPYAGAYSNMYNTNAAMAQANSPMSMIGTGLQGLGTLGMGAGMMGWQPFK